MGALHATARKPQPFTPVALFLNDSWCSAFAQRDAAERQDADDDAIRHRETSAELLARTTQELEELRAENAKLRRREHEQSSISKVR